MRLLNYELWVMKDDMRGRRWNDPRRMQKKFRSLWDRIYGGVCMNGRGGGMLHGIASNGVVDGFIKVLVTRSGCCCDGCCCCCCE